MLSSYEGMLSESSIEEANNKINCRIPIFLRLCYHVIDLN